MSAVPLKDLREMPEADLIARHDALVRAPGVGDSVNYYLTELARRDQDRQTLTILGYTEQMRNMTIVILVLTVVNVVAVVVPLFR